MIPVLFDKDATTFTTMGLGGLSEAISCTVFEERNGEFELTMKYPVSGKRFKDVVEDNIIFASHEWGKPNEAFRIYKRSKPMNGIVTVQARHISYQLNFIPVLPFTASNCAAAMQEIPNHTWSECPFTFWTDKDVYATFSPDIPKSVRATLGGTNGSIMDIYGTGEFEWVGYTVKYWLHRGIDRGVTVRYGKNLVSLRRDTDSYDIIGGMYPYYKGEDGTVVTLPEGAVENDIADQLYYKKTVVRDCTENFDEPPTEDQLRSFATTYINRHNSELASESLTVDFVELAKTEQYKNYAPLEQIQLCDTVHVYHPKLDIDEEKKVISYEWNVLKDRYNKVTLGITPRTDLSTVLTESDIRQDSTQQYAQSIIQRASTHATDIISGVNGGYVVMHLDANRKPYEILIMDSENINTAVNVWRFNQNGWGHSSTGYQGPYTLAATLDGGLVADWITTGTLNASLIRAGEIRSADGQSFVFDIDNNSFTANRYDEFQNLYSKHFEFDPSGGLKISATGSGFYTMLSDTELGFYQAGQKIAYLSGYKLYITDVRVLGGFEMQNPTGDEAIRMYVDQQGVFCIQKV